MTSCRFLVVPRSFHFIILGLTSCFPWVRTEASTTARTRAANRTTIPTRRTVRCRVRAEPCWNGILRGRGEEQQQLLSQREGQINSFLECHPAPPPPPPRPGLTPPPPPPPARPGAAPAGSARRPAAPGGARRDGAARPGQLPTAPAFPAGSGQSSRF